jgi:hypothetical protein
LVFSLSRDRRSGILQSKIGFIMLDRSAASLAL